MTTELYVGVDPKGSHRVYRSKNGISQVWVGPPFAEPADAIAYAAKLRGIPQVPATRPGQPQTRVAQGDGAAPIESPDPAAPPVDVTGDSIGFGF